MSRLYTDARARAITEYPAILGIHECPAHVYRQPTSDLLRRLGYEHYEQRIWDIDKNDYTEHARGMGNFAGQVLLVSDGHGDRPLVLIMRPAPIRGSAFAHGWMMGVLFHELGHVDDIVRGLHLRLDTCVDITAAEEHAHLYACQRIMREADYIDAYMTEVAPNLRPSEQIEWRECAMNFYRPIMALYIGEILPKYSKLPHDSVREAARRVLESDDMAAYRRFAGGALDDYRL